MRFINLFKVLYPRLTDYLLQFERRLTGKIKVEPAHKVDMPDHGGQYAIEISAGDIVVFVEYILQGQGVPENDG
jgi:hypothetical protein